MNEIELKAADWVISIATLAGRSTSGLHRTIDVDREVLKEMPRMAEYLQRDGLVSVTRIPEGHIFKLTPDGDEFKKTGKKYADFLATKSEKEERA